MNQMKAMQAQYNKKAFYVLEDMKTVLDEAHKIDEEEKNIKKQELSTAATSAVAKIKKQTSSD